MKYLVAIILMVFTVPAFTQTVTEKTYQAFNFASVEYSVKFKFEARTKRITVTLSKDSSIVDRAIFYYDNLTYSENTKIFTFDSKGNGENYTYVFDSGLRLGAIIVRGYQYYDEIFLLRTDLRNRFMPNYQRR